MGCIIRIVETDLDDLESSESSSESSLLEPDLKVLIN